MYTVTVSPKYQIVIPRHVREALGIKPGQKMAIFNINGSIHLVPVRSMDQMCGFLKGMTHDGLREKRDRKI